MFVPYILLKFSNSATISAKAVFGKDMVLDAYLMRYVSAIGIEEKCKAELKDAKYDSGLDPSIMDYENIVIKFKNNNLVSFTSCEFGSRIRNWTKYKTIILT